MANVTVTSTQSNINVSSTPSNITVTDLDSNNQINVTQTNTTITVGSTVSNIIVSNVAPVSNADVRTKISVENIVGGYGNLTYDNSITSNGVISYQGVTQTDILTLIDNHPANVRQHISVTDTGGDGSLSYSNTTGVITYTGPSAAEVRAHISNTAPVLYNATTGVISLDTDAVFSNTLANNWFTTQTTDNLTEGNTNLYYTESRVRNNMANTLVGGANITITPDLANNIITIDGDLTGDIDSVIAGSGLTGGGSSGDVTLNVGAGTGITVNADNVAVDMTAFTTDNLAEGNTNLYYTQARFDSAFSGKTTTDLAEGTNLYYTNARANAAFVDSLDNITVPIVSTANITTTGNVQGATLKGTGAVGLVVTGNATIGGNLDVTGNINSETVVDLFVEDRNITMQYGQTAGNVVPSANSQIFIDRGTEANTFLIWSEADDKWGWSNDGTNVIFFAETTDGLVEGSTNLYFTNARANAAFVDSLDNITVPIVSTANITTTANVQGSWFVGNVDATQIDVVNMTVTGNVTSNANIDGNLYVGGTVFATAFDGDGSDLTSVRAETVEEKVINKSGGLLAKGTPVYATGNVTADVLWVDAADASDPAKMPVIGVLATDLANDTEGRAIITGRISGVDTATPGFVAGDQIFVAVGGGYANVAPTGEGNIIQFLGTVTEVDVSGGGVVKIAPPRSSDALNEGNIFLGDTNNETRTVTPDSNFDTTGNVFSLSNTLTDVNSISSELASNIILKGQANGLVVNKTINSTQSEVAQIDTTGYAIELADFGAANITTSNVPSILVQVAGTAGTNTMTATLLFGGAFGPVIGATQNHTGGYDFNIYSLFGGLGPGMTTADANRNLEGWVYYDIATASTTSVFPANAYVTGISGNTITFSENLTNSVSYGGSGFSGILLPAAASSTQEIIFTITGDTSTAGVPFLKTQPRGNKYKFEQTLSNVTLDAVSYADATVDLANIVMRRMVDVDTGLNGSLRTPRQVLVGKSGTPDVLSIGEDGIIPATSGLGLVAQYDGKSYGSDVDTTPQLKFLLNQFRENSLTSYTTYPNWTEFLGRSNDANVDMSYLGAPTMAFKVLGGNIDGFTATQTSDVVGRLQFNAVIPGVTSGSDVFHPPASIVARVPGDPDAPANATLANVDMHFQSTYATSYRNGANTAGGTIPRTFLSSSDGNTIIAAKSDGKITLRPVRDYGDTGTATSYVENRFAHELHNYHEFLGASFANTTAKTGTLVEIQSKSGETGGSTDFNYDSKGDAILRLSTHLANGDVSAYWDINNDITAGNLTISKDGTDRLVLEDSNIHVTNNVHAQYFIGNVDGTTATYTGNITANNITANTNLSATTANLTVVETGNITLNQSNSLTISNIATLTNSAFTYANISDFAGTNPDWISNTSSNINVQLGTVEPTIKTVPGGLGGNVVQDATMGGAVLYVDGTLLTGDSANANTINTVGSNNIIFDSNVNFRSNIYLDNRANANATYANSMIANSPWNDNNAIKFINDPTPTGIEIQNIRFPEVQNRTIANVEWIRPNVANASGTYASNTFMKLEDTDANSNIMISAGNANIHLGFPGNTGLHWRSNTIITGNDLKLDKPIDIDNQSGLNNFVQSTTSNVATITTDGYTVTDLDLTEGWSGPSYSGNVPALLVQMTATAGSNAATFSPLFGGAFGATLFAGRQTSAAGYAFDVTGADMDAAFLNIAGTTGAQTKGWIFYHIATGSASTVAPWNSYIYNGDSANVVYFTENFTSNVSAGGAGYNGILLPAVHFNNYVANGGNIHARLVGDTSNANITFTHAEVYGQDYRWSENFDGQLLNSNASYRGSAAYVGTANVVTRHIADIDVGEGSAVRINQALLIGANATPDVYSGGNAITSEASILGVTLESDGLTTFTNANSTPQTKFLINQYSDNSPRTLGSVPNWATVTATGDDTEDLLNLGAPAFNFKYLNGNKEARNNLEVTANTVVGKIQWNAICDNATGSDVIYPPAAITVRVPADQTQTGANGNVAATDFYAQSTYRTSYRNGTTNANGGIPRTFLASQAGNTIIAAKTDGRIALKPVRDYGNDSDATSFVENRYPQKLHDYHTFLDAKFITGKTGTIVTIQPDSGETGGNTDFNYDSKGNAVLRFQTHLANNDPRYNFDIVHDEANEKLFIESGVANQQHIEIASAGKVSMKQVMRMHPLSNSAILALTGNELGDMVVSSDANKICFYNGTNWVTIDTNTVIV